MSFGAALGGAASLYTAVTGGSQNQQNRAAAAKGRHWSKMMSDTSYQRSMADMRAAGLNPMLAYQQGGANSPGATTSPVVNEMEKAASSTSQMGVLAAQVKNIAAQTKNTNVKTAFEQAQLDKFKKYGSSTFGNQGDSAERIIERIVGQLKQETQASGSSARDPRAVSVGPVPAPGAGKRIPGRPHMSDEGYNWYEVLRAFLGLSDTTASRKRPPVPKEKTYKNKGKK